MVEKVGIFKMVEMFGMFRIDEFVDFDELGNIVEMI